MLKISKSITLTGISEIEGQQAVYMNATVSTDGDGRVNINKSITNQELYNKNKKVIRKDMSDFESQVHEVEDNLSAEVQE
ncbi:hypothetical protein K5V21_03575 [Clostridium sardiniense]|uniref:Prophage protein n=1 Tax=Clostridium sardiniense TaxID=29369 RepID=A0ABS7KUP2_CLOSR|nr:hypothetical protein [Clostridium sardiniense]MBY0754531.1 hypothetical protein [Clostridium sardiniense]MDQ0460873.1 hypothetical protein [Clostridium sardiniense]